MKTQCPGQDTRFWKADSIFDVTCVSCKRTVEFFPDDATRLCKCGQRIKNPKLSYGCAEWCPSAGKCVGYVIENKDKQLEFNFEGTDNKENQRHEYA